jgi:hypothetical protein
MCAKITLNVTPFDSGQVVLGYHPPYYPERSLTKDSINMFQHVPHADLDLSEQTAAELRVPYYAPKRYISVLESIQPNNLGNFFLCSPTDSIFAGNSSEYKLYMWIEDVELLFPTNLVGNTLVSRIMNRKWSPQGPDAKKVGDASVVLSQPYYDSNYGISGQAVPACLNVVSNSFSEGSTDSFYDLFKVPGTCYYDTINTATPYQVSIPVKPNSNPYSGFAKLALAKLFFKFYSGSINYRLKLYMTKFHSGRMQVAFLPKWGNAPIPTSLDDFWNIVWDFREASELEFSVPYIDDMYMTQTNESQGLLVFRTLNPIQAPDNVSTTIKYILETWAGDDFKVAAPYASRMMTIEYPVAPTVKEDLTWEPQGPKSIADKPVEATSHFLNESDCTISSLVTKISTPTPMEPAVKVGRIYIPPSITLAHLGGAGNSEPVSNCIILANIFQFYRGDVISKAGTGAGYDYYTNVATLDSEFPVYPYICNLRYNEVAFGGAPGPVNREELQRLHNATFFYPWYTVKVSV